MIIKHKRNINKNKFKIIIDDGSHLLNDIINNLKFFLKFVEPGGYYIIEDYNHPEYYVHLNNSSGNELFVKDIINKIKNKDFFESKILNKNDQKELFENIKEIASSIKILSQEEDKKKLIEEDDDVEEIISKNFFI